MDNAEYIKSLEERIEKLEAFIKAFKFEECDNISISNCTFQGIGLERCKNIKISDITTENVGIASFKTNIEHATINTLGTNSAKVKIKNCTINDKKETE